MTKLITYRDRSYPNGELEIIVSEDYLKIEYSPDGYTTDWIYVPRDLVFGAICEAMTIEDDFGL